MKNYDAVKTIEDVLPAIELACDEIYARMSRGGCLIYMGQAHPEDVAL